MSEDEILCWFNTDNVREFIKSIMAGKVWFTFLMSEALSFYIFVDLAVD